MSEVPLHGQRAAALHAPPYRATRLAGYWMLCVACSECGVGCGGWGEGRRVQGAG
jgi:hypothetical protein